VVDGGHGSAPDLRLCSSFLVSELNSVRNTSLRDTRMRICHVYSSIVSMIFIQFLRCRPTNGWHSFRPPTTRSCFHSSTVCHLNRFLFDPNELDDTTDGTMTATLPKDDYRTIHAAKILKLHNGDTIRAGLVSCDEHNGLTTDEAVIEWIPEGKVKKAEPLGNGNPPGSIRIRLESLLPPSETLTPSVSLILVRLRVCFCFWLRYILAVLRELNE
jgi:hypothetical protein